MIIMIITILFIYLIYYIWIINNYDKQGNLKKHKLKKKETQIKKIPSEFQLFVNLYKIDLKKVNYRYFLQFLSLIISIDLGITVTIIGFINNIWLKIIIGFIFMLLIVFISFKIAGSFFKKKGLVLTEDKSPKKK